MSKLKSKLIQKSTITAVCAVVVFSLIIFAIPATVKAVTPSLPDIPSTMYTNSIYMFHAQVDLDPDERIPIQDLKFLAYDSNGNLIARVYFDIWGNILLMDPPMFQVTITPDPPAHTGYGYGYGYGYGKVYGYGYGYQPGITPSGYGYFEHYWGKGYGYGYGYGYQFLPMLRWLVTFSTAGLPPGDYVARFSVNVPPAPKQFISRDYPFTIVAAPAGGGGGGGGAPPPPPGEEIVATGSINLAPYLDDNCRLTNPIRLCSDDGNICIYIPVGCQISVHGACGGGLRIVALHTPPPPPGYEMVGLAYEFALAGTEFSPPATMSASYDPADIPDGVSEEDLVLAYYDGEDWVLLPSTVNTADNEVSADIEHLTPFAILAKLPAEAPAPPPPAPAPPPPAPAPAPPAPAPAPAPPPAPAPAPETNWALIGGIIAAVVVVGLVIYFVVARRRTA